MVLRTGGDGPKIVELDQMRDKYQTLLRDRVELLGGVKHEDVRDVSVIGCHPTLLARIPVTETQHLFAHRSSRGPRSS